LAACVTGCLLAGDLRAGEPAGKRPPPIQIGVEYAVPGLGKTFGALKIPAVKFYPGLFAWGKMQKNKDAPIDFTMLDRLVVEYQDAGFEEIYVSLSTINFWAMKGLKNYTPKKEYWPHFEDWIQAVVERYDHDGVKDMPGLKRPLRYYEISEEFSSYAPEPLADYLTMLERAGQAARSAYPKVQILHAAFLTTGVFRDHPKPAHYPAAFANAPRRYMVKTLDDIRAVLDRPKLFDAVNFHSLGDPYEIEGNVAWLRYEMAQRKYTRPIIISDTTPNLLIGWGPATKGGLGKQGLLTPPATEQDRPRLADYFQKLIDRDKATWDFNHAFVAHDMVQRVIIAAEQGVSLINTAFMEDLPLFQTKLIAGGAGTSAWAGMAETKLKPPSELRTITGLRAPFFAIQQLQNHLRGYDQVVRIATGNKQIRLYHWRQGRRPVWLAWLDPGKVVFPGDDWPSAKLTVKTGPGTFVNEPVIDRPNQTRPMQEKQVSRQGALEITMTPRPVYVLGTGPE
jgi:hypothetical protein